MMLEEAGAETIGTVIATLKPSDQGEFAAQVNGLVTLGLIRKEENNLVLTEQGRSAPPMMYRAFLDVIGLLPVGTANSRLNLGCANNQPFLRQACT
jgi:hypothetical protein